MHRRTFLAGALPLLAGCSGSTPDGTPATAPPTTAATEYPNKVLLDHVEVRFTDWARRRSLTYERDDGATATVTPPARWWVRCDVTVYNLGGLSQERPPMRAFALLAGGETVEPRSGYPVDYGALSFPDAESDWPRPGYPEGTTDQLASGERQHLTLLFSAPADETPLLRWTPDEGGPFTLAPDEGP